MSRLGLLLCAPALAACVQYRKAPLDLARAAEARDAVGVVRLDFAAALAHAHEHHPELRRLTAEARAAGWQVPETALGARGNFNRDHVEATVDPLALLHLGPRGAAARLADSRAAAAAAALRRAEWRMAGEIAEAFAVEGALAARAAPELDLDGEPFRRAGLASEEAVARLAHARAAASAEAAAIRAERDANRARLRERIGLGDAVRLELTLPAQTFPKTPVSSRAALLARPDLDEVIARYETADAEFRLAVADQYPSLRIGGEINLSESGSGPLVALRIPLGASRPARAAGERREAARHAAESALLAAQREAAEARAALVAAQSLAAAARRGDEAGQRALATATTRVAVSPDAFDALPAVAIEAVNRARAAREAEVAEARARVRAAAAYGWPFERNES